MEFKGYCKDCDFCVGYNRKLYYKCHRFPPSIYYVDNANGLGNIEADFPKVNEDYFCGEFYKEISIKQSNEEMEEARLLSKNWAKKLLNKDTENQDKPINPCEGCNQVPTIKCLKSRLEIGNC